MQTGYLGLIHEDRERVYQAFRMYLKKHNGWLNQYSKVYKSLMYTSELSKETYSKYDSHISDIMNRKEDILLRFKTIGNSPYKNTEKYKDDKTNKNFSIPEFFFKQHEEIIEKRDELGNQLPTNFTAFKQNLYDLNINLGQFKKQSEDYDESYDEIRLQIGALVKSLSRIENFELQFAETAKQFSSNLTIITIRIQEVIDFIMQEINEEDVILES